MNFEYSLINQQGTLLEYKQGEDKMPVLNFTLQNTWDIESQKNNSKS